MSEPEAPTPPAEPNPYATPATTPAMPPPSYDEHRAATAQQPYPQFGAYAQYGGQPQQPYGPPNPWPVTPQPERIQGTNGFAVATLVFGIIGGIPLAIIFGVIALGRTANGRQQGRGMAVAGLVCAGLWLTGMVAAGVYAAVAEPDRDDSGRITEEGELSTYDVEIGDCLNGLRDVEADAAITSLPAVPCTEPHEGEVYASFELTGDDYPGVDGIVAQGDERCAEALLTYSTRAYEDQNVGLFYLYPDELGWPQDRTMVCIAVALEGTLTGSLTERPGT
ncbi:hypothetical protein E1262_15465 [Jiangella aurantiaca]|uniref:DUF4190 domain-containing protein n=1 Tax=Jiangella aurantiaca TaxID=2530373 RepID=A0A4R5ACU9_9ACTN|nr:DUF4190 domain-containing protein [Jiangella aurantiaca]TDD68644.1 hypothetical protein E1262_15465 [Jiangella aurantiaca]